MLIGQLNTELIPRVISLQCTWHIKFTRRLIPLYYSMFGLYIVAKYSVYSLVSSDVHYIMTELYSVDNWQWGLMAVVLRPHFPGLLLFMLHLLSSW